MDNMRNKEEKAMLLAADGREPVQDDECPEMAEEQYRSFSAMLTNKKAIAKIQRS